jgi:pimeloyl-ACP methyl ester carboxylesterase
MKSSKLINSYIVILSFIGLLFNSCNHKNEPIKPPNEFLIFNEFKFDINIQDAKTKLTTFQIIVPETSVFGPLVKNDVEVDKIIYKTTFKENNIQASGLVCLPKTAGNYPILCFQNGTNTLFSEAPTENPGSDLLSILESVASMGFIVVIPDYIGFGVSSQLPHPYLDAASTTQSILDMLRAVKEFSSDDNVAAKPTKDLYIFGYSQGGWATMQLQKAIETNYSSEFNLIASSCAAGPYSLEFMNEYITSKTDYPMPYFLAYLLNSYHNIGLITNPLSDFIQEPYASKIPGLFDGQHSGGTINTALTTKMADLLTPEYRTQYATNPKFTGLKSAFFANSVAPWNISTPTRLYHGGSDEFIPVSLSTKMLQDFKTKGVPDTKIQMIIIPGFDHPSGVVPVGLSTIIWFVGLKK